MIYLDNAATSYPKPENVYESMNRCMREYCANPGRGGHAMSLVSGQAVMETREMLSRFFNIGNPLSLCFTKNATESLNIAIKGSLKPGDHVITTSMEHNSVIRPLKTLERDQGIQLTIVKGNPFGEVDPQDIQKEIKKNTTIIACTLSSNVNGIVMPVKEIGKIAREHGLVFLVDASQGAGTLRIDVEELNIDLLAFPGHKGLLGPQGTGCLFVRDSIKVNPIMEGGTGSRSEILYQPEFMPDALESGTLNTPGIVGLREGIQFIENFGLENIKQYKQMLVQRIFEGISEIEGIKTYSKEDPANNSGIVALRFDGLNSNEVSYALDKAYDIAVRAGLHCAPMAHETLGTQKTGLVRLSVGCFNTIEEIDQTLGALGEIAYNQ